MTRRRPLIILAALLVVAALGGLATTTRGARPPVYTVDDVVAGLSQHPQDWVGRTVLIWGRDIRLSWWCGTGAAHAAAASCPQGTVERLVPARPTFSPVAPRAGWTGYPPPATAGIGSGGLRFWRGLMVTRRPGVQIPTPGEPNALALRLAQVPVVGTLVPARLRERGAVYRVRLLDVTRCASPSPSCPQGILQ